MPSLFRRKPADLVEDQVAEVAATVAPDESVPKGFTPKKGEATPKRPTTDRRGAKAVPKDPKEAKALARKRRVEEATERREGMLNGDDDYLGPRDKGPLRRYVRDIVDARRNAGSVFFAGVMAIMMFSVVRSAPLQIAVNLGFIALVLVIGIDSTLLCRRVRQRVNAKFPGHAERWPGLFFYAIMRAISFRRMRIPRPQVKLGDKV